MSDDKKKEPLARVEVVSVTHFRRTIQSYEEQLSQYAQQLAELQAAQDAMLAEHAAELVRRGVQFNEAIQEVQRERARATRILHERDVLHKALCAILTAHREAHDKGLDFELIEKWRRAVDQGAELLQVIDQQKTT